MSYVREKILHFVKEKLEINQSIVITTQIQKMSRGIYVEETISMIKKISPNINFKIRKILNICPEIE